MSRPRYLGALARILIPRRDREFVGGDLDELWAMRASRDGRFSANLRYVADVLRSATARPPGGAPVGPSHRKVAASTSEGPLAGLVGDLRRALRVLARRPGFALIVVVTVALGVGPTAAVFGLIEQLLLRPLPGVVNTASAAYMRFTSGEALPQSPIPMAVFERLRTDTTLLKGASAYSPLLPAVSFGDDRPVLIDAMLVYGDYFEVLGARPSVGRLLTAADTEREADELVAVISEPLRDDLFGEDAEAVDRVIRMDGHPVRVVGVTADGFLGSERGSEIRAWLPFGAINALRGESVERFFSGFVNRFLVLPRPGVDFEVAELRIGALLAELARTGSEGTDGLSERRPVVYGGLHTPPPVRDTTRDTLSMMAWAVALILAIACASVANLLLFRNTAMRGIVATRRALGASTGRIAREQLAQSALLGAFGTLAGIGVAWLIVLPFQGRRFAQMPAFEGFALAWPTLPFLMMVAAASILLFGVVPALLAARFDLGAALKASHAGDGGRIGGLRTALAVGQLGLTLSLVAGGMLMVRTMANLNAVPTGLDIDGVAALPITSRSTAAPNGLDLVRRRLLAAVREVPEVEAAALDVYGPHGGRIAGRLRPIGGDETQEIRATNWPVTPGWFEVFRVHPLHGRVFVEDDWVASGSPSAVVLTASLARRLFGRIEVTGQTVVVPGPPREFSVLGVVPDYTSMATPAEPSDAYFTMYPAGAVSQMTVVARMRSYGVDVAARLREAVESALPAVPVPDPSLLQERVDGLHQEERVLGRLLWILSTFAMLLAAVGLYGVISFIVSARTRELGVRRALGADGPSIVRLVTRSGLFIMLAGTILGLAGAYGLARLLQGMLFGVGSVDFSSYAGAAALLTLVAALACLAPARDALRVDPATILRQE